MKIACVYKSSLISKATNSKTFSVLDSSSQGESLQRKAGLMNNAAQLEESSRPNNTGMPDNLKTGIESLSGFSMDDVRVYYNSSKPATVQALAYTQGTDIHVAPGQEKCLPHEAWHVAQQMAGRVSPTTNINGMPVNDNDALEHEADVMGEKAVQCKADDNTVCLLKNLKYDGNIQSIQRATRSVTFADYDRAYRKEMQKTGTRDILRNLGANPDGNFQRLQFVDDYSHCGVIAEDPLHAFPVKRVKVPEPNLKENEYIAPDFLSALTNETPVSRKLMSRKKMNKMLAIHEFEHLRVMNENKVRNLRNTQETIGEPFNAEIVIGPNQRVKCALCNALKECIPDSIDEKLKEYIRKRIDYIKVPMPDKSTNEKAAANDTAREFPSVLVELMYLCDNYPKKMSVFKAQLNACYKLIMRRG